jgi:CHASE2 domain-containing sensor protein
MARYWLTLIAVLWLFVACYLLITGAPLRPMLPLLGTASLICLVGMLASLFARSGT